MKLLPKSDILFSATKDELIQTKQRPKSEYKLWLKFKQAEQKIDELLSTEKYLVMMKY